MKNSQVTAKRNLLRFGILGVIVGALAIFPLLTKATVATSVNIVNNSSSRSIQHVYVSHVNADDWSSDKLNGQAIPPGQSTTLSNLSCDQSQLKVIGEDLDGCFLTVVVSCGTDNTWTITNSTAADCGTQ